MIYSRPYVYVEGDFRVTHTSITMMTQNFFTNYNDENRDPVMDTLYDSTMIAHSTYLHPISKAVIVYVSQFNVLFTCLVLFPTSLTTKFTYPNTRIEETLSLYNKLTTSI